MKKRNNISFIKMDDTIRVHFVKTGVENPDGLPESSNIKLFEINPYWGFSLRVTFQNGARYAYKIHDQCDWNDDLRTIMGALMDGYKGLTPGQVFRNYIFGKCAYQQIP